MDSITSPELQRVDISDAASMFRRKVLPTDLPYTQIVTENNNEIVDAWKAQVLDKIVDSSGKAIAAKIGTSFSIFYDYYTCNKFEEYKHLFPRLNDTQMNEILGILDTNLESLYDFGYLTANLLLESFQREIQFRMAELKYQEFYSKHSIISCLSKTSEINSLQVNIVSNEKLQEISKNVLSLIASHPQSEGLSNKKEIRKMKHRIHGNLPQSLKTIFIQDNKFIEEFNTNIQKYPKLSNSQVRKVWNILSESKNAPNYIKYRSLILPDNYNPEMLYENLKKPCETLCTMSAGVVTMMWTVYNTILFCTSFSKRVEKFYQKNVWETLKSMESDTLNSLFEEETIFDVDTTEDICQKCRSIISQKIEPVY